MQINNFFKNIRKLEHFNTNPSTSTTPEVENNDNVMEIVLIVIPSVLVFICFGYILYNKHNVKTKQIIMILIFTIIYLNALLGIIYKKINNNYVRNKCNEIRNNDNIDISEFPLCKDENQKEIESNFNNLKNMVISNCIVGFIAFLITFKI